MKISKVNAIHHKMTLSEGSPNDSEILRSMCNPFMMVSY